MAKYELSATHQGDDMILKHAAVISLVFALAACQQAPPPPAQSEPAAAAQPSAPSLVERGKYLVDSVGCNDCHTPYKMGPNGPEPDMTRFLSGHPESVKLPPPPPSTGPWMWHGAATNTAYAGPWGITYATNLTPHQETGMGIWTEDMFVTAIKTGKHFGTARPIMPPMPWPTYRNLTEDDLKAIFAYLRSIPPIANHVPDYQPPPEP
jgi:mono/diheme cytochrome c family protein